MRTARALPASRRQAAGFTLVELMVGVVIGLLTTAVIAQALQYAENFRRQATGGSDAQLSAALGLYAVQRELQSAGYGMASSPAALGCNLKATYAGAAVSDLASKLAPVSITVDATGGPDTIRTLAFKPSAATATNYSIPTSLLPPYYDPADQSAGGKAFSAPVTSVMGFNTGDLVVLADPDNTQDCQVFQVSSTAAGHLNRVDDAKWNANKWPNRAYGVNTMAINLGAVHDVKMQVANGKLQSVSFDSAAHSADAAVDLQANVVNLKAIYGLDTLTAAGTATRSVDTYTTTAPTATQWAERRVVAVRVAILVRSSQYSTNANDVTGDNDANFYWHIGSPTTAPAGAVDCPTGGGKCIKLKHDFSSDWSNYRYKMFEMVVPLRNAAWHA